MISRDKRLSFEALVPLRERFIRKNHTYYDDLKRFYQFHVPLGSRVLDVGCGNGDLLASLKPSLGVGIDFCHQQTRTIMASSISVGIVETFCAAVWT
jgi:2-polyprenyl-3-methyl-5-hydroxy-6-metoxy-1,4-benzoquinol methylase